MSIDMPTAQEIFDTVVNHLRHQNKKSLYKKTEICAYRADRTTDCPIRCAAGILIRDDEYSVRMEGTRFAQAMLETKSLSDRLGIHCGLINSLQEVHDFTDPYQWEGRFLKIAKEFNLEYKKLGA